MITIETLDGDLVKVFKNAQKLDIGLHKLFGFISEKSASHRVEAKKRAGFEYIKDEWDCRFQIQNKDNQFSFKNLKDCKVLEDGKDKWKILTSLGEFRLTNKAGVILEDKLITEKDESFWLGKLTEILMLAIFAIIPILYFLQSPPEEVIEEKRQESKPITVKVIQQQKAVNIAEKNPAIKVKPLTKAQKSKRAVQRNLGFLGLVGSKNLKDAVGGVPQKLKKATAGAGKGGDAGSGGEVLTGLGKGLRKTTVGNTGVAGLGGVGTKGAGGGAGGYGNTRVASGEGSGISAISVGSNEMVLEGGLSRYAINATISKYLSQIQRCYEGELNKRSKTEGFEGVVTVAFQINGTGMLNYANIKNTSLNSTAVEKCMTKKMMNWRFPKPKGGVNVNINYPFQLRPVGT